MIDALNMTKDKKDNNNALKYEGSKFDESHKKGSNDEFEVEKKDGKYSPPISPEQNKENKFKDNSNFSSSSNLN